MEGALREGIRRGKKGRGEANKGRRRGWKRSQVGRKGRRGDGVLNEAHLKRL